MSVLDTLKGATAARRLVSLYVDGSAEAECEAIEAEITAMEAGQGLSLASTEMRDKILEREAVRERMLASEVTFELRAIPWSDLIALQADHPPRDGNLADRLHGYNVATYYPALIRRCAASVTDAEGDTLADIPGEVWAGLLGDDDTDGTLPAAAINKLATAAREVNEKEATVPPSARSLLESQDSGASLAQPSLGESAPDDSAVGSRPTSPRSSGGKKARTKARSDAT